eukprot:TRINITY_DN16366_c0_g1_i1.p1 TRINITY_DN16366_c0_g1~~TRINITY_DN16366_c0_g1_i1.p1  ORF type:complete len:160 (+),score=22.51 TRINITY_DN16366_c0_g1_i1:119-598(+)
MVDFSDRKSEAKQGLRLAATSTLSTPRTSAEPSPKTPRSACGPSSSSDMSSPMRRSAAVSFLEEKLDIAGSAAERPCTRELLYRGVSADGQGRRAYLRERVKYGVEERYGQPVTEAQVQSLSRRYAKEVRPPQFGHKPIIANSFFRTRGGGSFKEATAF